MTHRHGIPLKASSRVSARSGDASVPAAADPALPCAMRRPRVLPAPAPAVMHVVTPARVAPAPRVVTLHRSSDALARLGFLA